MMLYATGVLGNFSVTLYRIRETHLSNSMAVSTNYLRIPVLNLVSRNKPTSHITRMTCCCSVEAKSVGVGGDVFSVTSSSKSDVDYLGESTKGDLNLKLDLLEAFGISYFPFVDFYSHSHAQPQRLCLFVICVSFLAKDMVGNLMLL